MGSKRCVQPNVYRLVRGEQNLAAGDVLIHAPNQLEELRGGQALRGCFLPDGSQPAVEVAPVQPPSTRHKAGDLSSLEAHACTTRGIPSRPSAPARVPEVARSYLRRMRKAGCCDIGSKRAWGEGGRLFDGGSQRLLVSTSLHLGVPELTSRAIRETSKDHKNKAQGALGRPSSRSFAALSSGGPS